MSSEPPKKTPTFNLPNQITSVRIVLAVIMFGIIPLGTGTAYLAAAVLFLLAAGTDWLDGYIARKYQLVTVLGRILDPFADKLIICGAFILLVAVPEMAQVPLGLRAWMVVVVVARELLVTALRSFLEEGGTDFSAKMSGKLKMVVQCAAVALALVYLAAEAYGLAWADGLWLPLVVSIWGSVAMTIYSGLVYVRMAARLLRKA